MSLAIRSALVSTLILTLAFLARPALAQGPSSGALSGVVTDSLDLPLQGIGLTLRNVTTGASRAASTERDGRFRFALLTPGEYDLRVEGFGYHPRWLTRIRLHAGSDLRVRVPLAATDPTLARLDSARFDGRAAAGSVAGRGLMIPGSMLDALPDRARDLAELASLASPVGDGFSIEGLPGSMTQLRMDGVPMPEASLQVASTGSLRGMSLPFSDVAEAEIVTGAADVEWGGAAGGIVNASTATGTREFAVRGFGAWSTADADPAVPGGDALELDGMRAGILVSGPIAQDTSAFVVGIEARRLPALLHPARGIDSLTSGFGRIAAEQYDESLSPDGFVRSLDPQVLTGFGRLDWRLSDAHHLRVGASIGTATDAAGGVLPERAPFATAVEGSELGASAALASRLGRTVWHELQVGFHSADRDYSARDLAGSPDLPASTLIVVGPLGLGDGPGVPRSTAQSTMRLGSAFHFGGGSHRFKAGFDLSRSSYESTFDDAGAHRFVFADLDEFAAGRGMFTGFAGGARGTSFEVPAAGVFLQDTWTPMADVSLLAGVRWDTERLPSSDIQLNDAWFARTGIDNRDAPSSVGGFSPRAALTWDVGQRHEWIVRAAGGTYVGRVHPELVADALALDGGVGVSRGVGDLGGWPAAPPADVAPVIGARIAILDPDARAPRTTRGSAGVSRYLGAGTSVHLSGTVRRTDFLARRSDLNLVGQALLEDQYGRPIYGDLELSGGLLAAAGSSNRRFVDVERVDLTSTDGWSEYRGITAAIERTGATGLTILGSYTFSSTRDNWSSRFPLEGSIDPFPGDSSLAGWTEATSDLDVPHRAVVGAQLRLASFPALSLAGVYRFRSGLPFTPGFGRGIDANGDGFRGNDPAYVDGGIAGTDALFDAFSCLREQQGGFAERNSCRGDARHTLDLRLALRMAAGDRFAGELFVDGLDLVRSGDGDYPDPALYLLDPAGLLASDAGAGTVTVPLVVNPRFGEPLAGTAPGRTVRIGVRINY